MNIEKRSYNTSEIRASSDANGFLIEGYASVFNSLSEDLGGFREIILPGAFADVLDGEIKALQNHDGNYLLGDTGTGTLSLREDNKGLFNQIKPVDTSYARDLMALLTAGVQVKQSFSFSVPADGSGERWYVDDDGVTIREIGKLKRLYETSILTGKDPAYPAAGAEMVSARALEKVKEIKDAQASETENAEAEVQAGRDLLKRRVELAEAE